MIITTKKMVFVTDPEDSNEYIEYLRTEYDTNQYNIKIDKTCNPFFYELFHEWKEGKRKLSNRLFASGKLEKKLLDDIRSSDPFAFKIDESICYYCTEEQIRALSDEELLKLSTANPYLYRKEHFVSAHFHTKKLHLLPFFL